MESNRVSRWGRRRDRPRCRTGRLRKPEKLRRDNPPSNRYRSAVALTIDYGTRLSSTFTCDDCGATETRYAAYIYDDHNDTRVSWYLASCCHHNDQHEAYIDATLGTWETEASDDHVTFCCRVGPFVDSDMPACTLVDAKSAADQTVKGRTLTREEGLSHPRIGEFWNVVDTVLSNDISVNWHVYGHLQGS